jgi:acyl-CoA reductase-like NAD-dependent aldehyde dehydrogenase
MAGAASQVASIAALRERVRRAAVQLRALPVERRAAAIERAAGSLLDAQAPLGAELRVALHAGTGLSPAVIEHGLRTTLQLFTQVELRALYASGSRNGGPDSPPALAVAILAGNVFSAAARPVLLPLLCGVGVLAKAATHDDALPRFLQRALGAADPGIGAACAVTAWPRSNAALTSELLHDTDVISVYGSDDTVAAVRAASPPGARVLAHGHGLGAIAIARDALTSEAAARELAARAALDVAAYDQRGCLSPHFALVQAGGAVDARAFARLLAEALAELASRMPRGELPPDAGAEQLQWRGVAAAIGELHTGPQHATSYEAERPPRPSPGYRNLAVHDCADLTAARAELARFGPHLKALGVAGTGARDALATVAPYVCELGAMQTPPLHAALDGLHPLEGFRRR